MQKRLKIRDRQFVACGCIAAVACLLFILSRNSASRIAVNLVGQTNNASGNRLVLVCWTNMSSSRFQTWFSVEVLTNGSWHEAVIQPEGARMISDLAPRGSVSESVPVPVGAVRWRVAVTAQRYLGKFERPIEWICTKFSREYPLTKAFSSYSTPID